MNLEISARPAHQDELATVIALMREGRTDLADQRGAQLWLERDAIPEPLEPIVDSLISGIHALVELAFIDDVALGVLVATHDEAAESRVATVRELFVVPDARGVGLGEMLMDACLVWADAARCEGVDGYALPGDRATKNFFERFGMVARGIVVHRRLPPQQTEDAPR